MRIRDINKEQAIKQKALKMVVKEGFDGFSMQKLAKVAGVSPATIYIYFKDKEDLMLRLALEAGEKMTDITLNGFNPAMSFSAGMRVQWLNRARYCLEHPDQMYFLEQIHHSPFQDKQQEMMGDGFKNIMKEFVSGAIEREELVKIPMEVFWSLAFAPLYNLLRYHIAGRSLGGRKFSLSKKTMNKTLDLVLKALKPSNIM